MGKEALGSLKEKQLGFIGECLLGIVRLFAVSGKREVGSEVKHTSS